MTDVAMARDSRSGGSGRRVTISPPQGRASSAERLTPMPDYLRPVVRSAVTRWKKLHEDHMMEKLVMKRTGKKEHNKVVRQEAKNLARKIPMEVLARDWLCEQRATAETRAFLVDKLLPTLILGVEKLLVEVDKRGLSDTVEPDPNFNPINYLARYLMRNNPRYSNFCEASPYVRGLRQVGEQLKKQLFDIEENKLARIKAEARQKREERERSEEAARAEKHRRQVALRTQYSQWDVGLYPDGRVELALVQNGLLSFKELTESGLEEGEEKPGACGFTQELQPTDDTGKTLLLNEFIAYLKQYVEEMPADVFDQFMLHLSRCAETYRVSAEREQRRVLLTQVFVLCDHTGVGLLDRHRVLNLFEMFYDRAREDIKEAFRNPREWPVVDVLEIDSVHYSDEQNIGDNDNSVDVAKETAETDESVTKPGDEDKTETADNSTTQEGGAEADATAEGGETTGATAAAESAKTGDMTGKGQNETEAEGQNGTEAEGQNETEAEGQNETEAESQNETEAEGKNEAETEGQNQTEPEAKNETEAEKSKEVEHETEIEKESELETEKVDTQPEMEEKEEEANTEDRENEEDSKQEESEKEKEQSAEEEKERDEAAAMETSGVVLATTIPEEGEPELSGLTEDQGPAPPPRTGDRPPMTQQSRVSFAEGTTFERERTVLSTRGSRSQSQASAFDENTLNMSQFIQLTETFLGDEPHSDGFKQLVRWVREGYMETEEERANRLRKARKEVLSARRKALLNSLFEMWDNDGSGFLDLDEVETVMKKYKDGVEMDAIAKGKKDLRKKSRNHDNRLSKREFRDLVYKVVENMAGGNEHFDYFIDFLFNSVERSYAERVRGEARKKWLQQIVQAGETSATNMGAIYTAVFQALYKDAETHGNNKQISANIAMLEKNDVVPERGDVMLRYVAATPEDAGFVLGKALFRDMKSISFSCVETGKPIHVPRVNAHGGVHFWNPERTPEEREGAFIVIPLKDRGKRVFGLMGIDTLNDPHSRSIFITHEIQFYQGVAKAFSIAYHQVDVRQKTMRISESAVSWIHRRSPNVHEITVYMVEPDNKGSDYVLRKMMVTGHKGNITKYRNPARLERRDNLFRDYLFKCVDNSESVTADAYAERHLAIPIRNNDGLAVTVIDISIGELKALPRGENRELTKMLRLLQMAYREILTEAADGERTTLLEGEKVGDDNRTEILFDRLMLIELRGIMSKLDPKAYAELRSYHEPPKVIHQIVKAVLSVFSPDKATSSEFDSWATCKQYITPQLSQQIVAYDPTSDDTEDVPAELIQEYLQDVPHGQVNRHGSIPAQYLYNWVFVCVSLIEHTRNMTRHRNAELNAQNLPPPNKKLKKNGASVAAGPEEGAEVAAPGVPQTKDAAQQETNVDGNNEGRADDAVAPPGGEEQGVAETSGGGENEVKAE